MAKYNRPNFLVVGAAKSGTTSLFNYLIQHPDIFIPERKECRYFSDIGGKKINPFTGKEHASVITNKGDYYKLFKDVKKKALGDVSPDYLFYYKESINNIINELGRDVRIIILLRNPINRAYSNYFHLRRDGNIPSNIKFEDVLEKEEEWEGSNVWWGFFIKKSGYYYNSVKNYLEEFDNVKIILFEEYIKSPSIVLEDLCCFLNIDQNCKFLDPAFKNKTGILKYKLLDKLINNRFLFKKNFKNLFKSVIGQKKVVYLLNRIKEFNLYKPKMDKNIQKKLLKCYSKDINSLEHIINKDLSLWKKYIEY